MTAREEISELLSTYARALSARDAVTAASCFSEGAAVMAPSVPTAHGREAVQDLYTQIVGALRLDISFEIVDVIDAGAVTVVFTTSSGTQTTVADEVSSPEANREVFVLARDNDGWAIQTYLFNTIH